MEADTVQSVGEGDDFLARAFAHKTDLDPVFAAQIIAVATEKIAGLLHGFADFYRIHFRRQCNGDDRRRYERAVTNQLKAHLRQTPAQPGRPFGGLGEASFPIHMPNGGVQRMEQIGGKGKGGAVVLRAEAEVKIARQLSCTAGAA